MSLQEVPKFQAPRPSAQVYQEYAGLCTRAGALQYEIKSKSGDLDKLNKQLTDLNLEFLAAQNMEAEKAKAEKAQAEAAEKAKAEADAEATLKAGLVAEEPKTE